MILEMKTKIQIGIIGLGKFGFKFGQTLVDLGHDVLGIDASEKRVKNAQYSFTQVYQADATNKEVLKQMRIDELEHVVISVGDSIAASIMISMYLKELGVENVWVKAIHHDHEKLLYKIGADKVIIPEYMAAQLIANRIAMPGFIEQLPFGKSMGIKEFEVKTWAGKTLKEIDMTNIYNVQVIAIKKAGQKDYSFIPKAGDTLKQGDIFVAIGTVTQLSKINS